MESRALRVVAYNRPGDEEGTLFRRTGQGVPEFGNRLDNLRDLAKNRLAIQLRIFENSLKKPINSMLFWTVTHH
jgi:hypothetical protein